MADWNIIDSNGIVVATVKKVEYHGKLMDERYVLVDLESPTQIGLSADDYMMYNGEKFSIRNAADVEKCARPQTYGGAFSYKGVKLIAESWQQLKDTEMTDYVYNDNTLHYTGLGTFSFYMTKVSDMGYRVQAVLDNKYGSGKWTVNMPLDALDDVDEAKSISVSSGTSVKDVLDMLWQNWGITYTVHSSYINGTHHYIDLRPSSSGSILLEYGKRVDGGTNLPDTGGLTKIARKINTDVEICTRVRAFGSERNMPYKWYNNTYNDVNDAMFIPQLMLPHINAYYDADGNYVDGSGTLYQQGDEEVVGYVSLWGNPNDVVLENVIASAKYGKRDKEIHWNSDDMGEIFPSMKGMTSTEVGITSKTYDSTKRLDKVLVYPDNTTTIAKNEDGTVITSGNTSDLTTGKINFIVYVPNPGFKPTDFNTSENVELLMQSGMCQSRAFTIISSKGCDANGNEEGSENYVSPTVQYKLTCAKTIDEEIDQVFPNQIYTIESGDEYVYTGLEFSGEYTSDTWLSVYINAAEKRLLRAAAIWLKEHSEEDFVYELTIDNIYMKTNPTVAANLKEGAMIQIPDSEFGENVYETVDSLTIIEGKEDIPTYEVTLLKHDESESLGDRIKGIAGQTISASSEIAKANDNLARKVNIANLSNLIVPVAADGLTEIPWNTATEENTAFLKAKKTFFSVNGVSALGVGSSGGGGGGEGGDTLNTALASINNTIGVNNPTGSNQTFVWNGSSWTYSDVGSGGGGGTDMLTVWKSLTNNSSLTSYNSNTKIAAAHIPTLSSLSYDANNTLAQKFGAYLPLSGGALAGNLNVATLISTPYINLTESSGQLYHDGKFYNLPSSGGTLALVSDIGSAVSGYLADYVLRSTLINAGNGLSGGGSLDDDVTLSLATVGSAGTYTKVTTDAYGRVTSGTTLSASDIPTITKSKISDFPTTWAWSAISGKPTTLSGYGITNAYTKAETEGKFLQISQGMKFVNFGGGYLSARLYNESGNYDTSRASVAQGSGFIEWWSTGGYFNHRVGSLYAEGNIGIGTTSPSFRLQVNGDSAFSGEVKMLSGGDYGANTWHIGYNAGASNSSFNIAHNLDGVMASVSTSGELYAKTSIGVLNTPNDLTSGFRFEYDSGNNTVWVLKANGQPVNFASMGGVTSLGVGSSNTPNISSMNIGTLTVSTKLTSRTAQVQNTLTVGSDNYEGNIVIRGNDGDDSYESIIYQSGDILNIEADSSLDISGATSINGNTSITGTLYVSGTTRLQNHLYMNGKRIYLDSTRYFFLDSGTLKYYDGSSSRTVNLT